MKEEKSQPEESLPQVSAMYETINNKHNHWGLEFYRVTPKYHDARKEKQNRQKTAIRIKVKATNKGHFLDGVLKQSCSPGPNKYNISPAWTKSKSRKFRALENKSFIDQIFFSQNKYKFPAPNAYNVVPTQQQTQAKIKKIQEKKAPKGGDRLSFVNTTQYQSLRSPGPGNYNPHEVRSPIQKNHFTPEQMIKHFRQKQKRIKQKLALAKIFDYNPIVSRTFAQRMHLPKYFEQNKATTFKKDGRSKKVLSKSMCHSPASNHYNVTQDWSSKSGIFKSLSNITHSVSVYR